MNNRVTTPQSCVAGFQTLDLARIPRANPEPYGIEVVCLVVQLRAPLHAILQVGIQLPATRASISRHRTRNESLSTKDAESIE